MLEKILKKSRTWLPFLCIAMLVMLFGRSVIVAKAENTTPYTVTVTTDRSQGVCSYQVSGIDVTQPVNMVVRAYYENVSGSAVVGMEKNVTVDTSNCINGVYTGSFSVQDFSNLEYREYKVSITIGEQSVVAANTCDFSIHNQNISVSIDASTAAAVRVVTLDVGQTAGDVFVSGANLQVKALVWRKGMEETAAMDAGTFTLNPTGTTQWNMDVARLCKGYGIYYTKFVTVNGNAIIGNLEFTIAPKASSFKSKKTSALEEKKSFSVSVNGLVNPVSINKVEFYVYNSKNVKVHTQKAKDLNGDDSVYSADIKLKSLDYKLDYYKVKVLVTDVNGYTAFLSQTITVNETASAKKLTITKKKEKRKILLRLTKAYIPGNIKEVKFNVYYEKSGKKVLYCTVDGEKKNSTYKALVSNGNAGKYIIEAYGYTNWNTKVLLKSGTVKVLKSEQAKNGWYYEKYNGKTYKFYYINGKKQTDLTEVLGLKYSSSSNVNNFYIEINRAAGCVTVYAYDSQKKKYIIPVKTFTVSVGRDISTVAGTSGLHEGSSYTPIGTYSICTNGVSVKYTVKPMYEPDGSTVYSRWCTHIVGNIYFHSIAVGSDSHYALNPYTYNRLGTPASAGCIRMTVIDSKWIYDYASTGSTVKIVKGDSSHPGPLGKTKKITVTSSIHYDPTDPEVPNSRKKADYKAGRISGYITKDGKRVGC